MTTAAKEPLLSGSEDYDSRFEVVDPGFSVEQEHIHAAAMEVLQQALKRGEPWEQAVAHLQMTDDAFKAVILDDCLKIILAERHFQGGEKLQKIAHALRLPTALLEAVKEDMIREVKEASIQVYRRSNPEHG